MSVTSILRPQEMESFRRCRRAWDLGARTRQNYVPIAPTKVFDFDKAIHDALAVYYFPAMDDWDRAIVRPLALQGFYRSMREQRQIYEKVANLAAEQDREWQEHIELGETMLNKYFEWAARVDVFASIFSDQDVWSHIPDPWNPERALSTPDDRLVRYLGRVDQLISDSNDKYWVVDHRITSNGFENTDAFLLDMVTLSYVWALEVSYPQLQIAGTIHNELRTDVYERDKLAVEAERDQRDMSKARHINIRRSPASVPQADALGLPEANHLRSGQDDRTEIVRQEGNEQFRRTHIRRSRASIENMGVYMAMQTLEMTGSELRIYPNPSIKNCPSCVYREPCIAMSTGLDLDTILTTHYRKRREEEFEEERLRWSSARRGTPAAFGSKALRSKEPW